MWRRARPQEWLHLARSPRSCGSLASAAERLRQRWPEGAARGAAIGLAAAGGFCLVGATATSLYTLNAVHASRRRYYTDEFVLTPEDLNMPYQEVQFFTEDGVSLTGWFIPQSLGGRPSRRVIICCHPYNSSKSNLLGVARGFWDQRYSVFMFDFRSFAHTPTRQSIGFYEQRDARAAIACARRTAPEGAAFGLVGASMGGAVALIVGHEAETDVVGIGTDCAFSGLADVLESKVSGVLRLPRSMARAIVGVAGALNPFLYGYRLSDVSPARVVAEGGSDRAGQVPLLLMHAENDELVEIAQAHKIYAAAAVPEQQKQLVVVQHCHHVGCFFKDRPGYIRQLTAFFDREFSKREAGRAAPPAAAAAEPGPQEAGGGERA